MNWEQVGGVLAHELAHIRNRDIPIGSVAAPIGMGITFAARMVMCGALLGGNNRDRNPIGELAFARLAPIAAMLIQAAVSRSREFQADESAARLLGTGEPLAQALQQLESCANRIPAAVDPSQASNYIIDPEGSGPWQSGRRFRQALQHPPVDRRPGFPAAESEPLIRLGCDPASIERKGLFSRQQRGRAGRINPGNC